MDVSEAKKLRELERGNSESRREAREAKESWRYQYNHWRHHESLGGLAPSVVL